MGEILWLGPAIQGGIGVVSLVVMFLLLKAFISSMDKRLEQHTDAMLEINKAIRQVTSMVAVLLGREEATPARGVELPDAFRKKKKPDDHDNGNGSTT